MTEEKVILKQSKEQKRKFNGNVFEQAKKSGWIKEFSKGQYFYDNNYTSLARKIENILIKKVAIKLGFTEYLFPKLIPIEIMEKMGYLEPLGHTVYYVGDNGTKPEYVLAPAQCEPVYWFNANKILNANQLPQLMLDRSGYTYRKENQNNTPESIHRSKEFLKIELTYLGTPKQVEDVRQQLLKKSLNVLDKVFEMDWTVEANGNPFYLIGKQKDNSYPKISKYRIKSGTPKERTANNLINEQRFELVSINSHGPHFTNTFNIKESKGKQLWTGCAGFGLNLWCAAFLAQHGFNEKDWPKALQ
ncbi:MAG: hypothetical protein NTY48_05155 [Candidatus Diapherotrites archaeon]|nr:hypothetical protein [Candidatus Diapherotrites archaeon]